MADDDLGMDNLRIEEYRAPYRAQMEARKKARCPVGRKYISERQRRLEYGLDVTNLSADTSAVSQRAAEDTTLEDSWLGIAPKKEGRLERLRKRHSLTRKTGKSMGGDFNQFTMPVPKFAPKIDLSSCDDDSSDEGAAAVQSEKENQAKPATPNDSLEHVGGSQGRVGQGCSTPRHVNNTLAMLKQIDVSAVSFNASGQSHPEQQAAAARSAPEPILEQSNRTVEMMEVDKTAVSEGDTMVLEHFTGKKKSVQANPTSETFTVREEPAAVSLQQPNQGTLVVEDIEATGGTYTIRSERGTFTVQPIESVSAVSRENDRKPVAEETESLRDVLHRAFLPPKIPVEKPKIQPNLAPSIWEAEVVEQKPIVEQKKSIMASGSRNTANKRQSVQFAQEVPPSPASRLNGFEFDDKSQKKPRIVPITPARLAERSSPKEIAKPAEPSAQKNSLEDDIPGTLDSSALQETPKRGSGSSVRRPRAIPQEQSTPHYARPTIASSLKSPRTPALPPHSHHRSFADDATITNNSSELSTFIDCEPDEVLVAEGLRSGYRPRHASKLFVQSRLRSTDSEDDESNRTTTVEERRRAFLERRLNGSQRQQRSMTEQSQDDGPTATVHVVALEPLPANMLPPLEPLPEDDDDEEPIPNGREPSADALPTTPTLPRRSRSHSDFGDLADPYEDDDVEGSPNSTTDDGIVIRRRQRSADLDSIFSPNATAPAAAGHRHRKSKRLQPREEDSMLEDDSNGRREMVLKPRKLIHPETPEDGQRRSKRTRIAPVRRWLGEEAVYQPSPNSGGLRLVGTNKVVITDPRYVKAGTTDPIKALDRERERRRKN